MTKPEINMDLFNKLTKRYSNQNKTNTNNRDFPDRGFDFASIHGTGKYIIRLMPYEKESVAENGSIMPFYIQTKHYNLGKDGKENTICTAAAVEGAVCPICDAISELSELGIDPNLFRKYELSTKCVIKCLMLKTPEQDTSALLMNRMTLLYVSSAVAGQIMKKYQDASTCDLFDPNKACAIVIERDKPRDKWIVSTLDSSCPESQILGFTEENKNKLIEISNSVSFKDIYKYPSDQKIMHYKELAREMKIQVINARNTVDTAANAFKAEIDASSQAAIAEMPASTVSTTMIQEAPVVATPVIPQSAVSHVVEQPKIEVPVAPVATPVTPSVQAQASGNEAGPDPDWTPEQKQIINSYRGICDKPCFGNLNAYDPKCARCMSDNFSAQCSAAIKLAYGVDVPLF